MTMMPLDPTQNAPTADTALSGTVVLSSSLRLLFIDHRAIQLMSSLDPHFRGQSLTPVLPPCLMSIAKDIATTLSTHNLAVGQQSDQVNHVTQLLPHSVLVRGFGIVRRPDNESRIVLVLSKSDLQKGPNG